MATKGLNNSKTSKKGSSIRVEGKSKIIFGFLCVLLFYPPFFIGLFYQKEILLTHILSFSLFSTYLLKKILDGDKLSIDRSFDAIGVLLIIAYILPIITFQWANLREAIGHVLRHINFFVIYLMVKDYAKEIKYKNHIIDVLILSGVVTASIGILAIAGYVNYQDAVLGNRISSTFQYPNTLAAFMMTLFFITATMQNLEVKLWKKNLYAASGFIMLLTFIFTYSRGAWLLFPIFAALYLLAIRGEDRVKGLLYLVAVGLSNLIILQPFMKQTSIVEDKNLKVIGVVVLGLALFALLYNASQWVLNKLQKNQLKLIYGFVGVVVVVATAFIVFAFNATEPLVFDNINATENRTNQIIRTVGKIEPNNEYIFKSNIDAFGGEDNQWPWRIRIYSRNQEGTNVLINEILGNEELTGEISIPFMTLEDTERLGIYFTNIFPNTKVTFNNASIYDANYNMVEEINLSYKYLPESLINRFSSINFSNNSSSTRMEFYKDSFKIFKDNPIVGAGGGAWNSLYPMYQTHLYHSTEAHNHFSQTLVETGIVGIVLMLMLIISLLILAVKSIRKKDTFNTTLIIAIASLLAHSTLDFNFSYLSIPIVLWALIALIDVDLFTDIKYLTFNKKLSSIFSLIVILPLVFVSFSLYGGNQLASQAVKKVNSGEIQEGINSLEQATTRDIFNVKAITDYANVLIVVASSTEQNHLYSMAEEELLKAKKYAPYSMDVNELLAHLYMQTGEFDTAIEYSNKIIELAPMRQSGYESKSLILMRIGDYYAQEQDKAKALEMYKRTLTVIDDIIETNQKADKPIILSDETLLRINKAKYLINNWEKKEIIDTVNNIVFVSYFDTDVDNSGVPDDWKISQGIDSKFDLEITNKGALISNTGTGFGLIYSPDFTLRPDTDYKIEFELEGNVNGDFIVARVLSRNGTSNQFIQRINVKEESNIYSFNFTTKEDIEPEGQYIRFDHLGNTDESFVINKTLIYEIENAQ